MKHKSYQNIKETNYKELVEEVFEFSMLAIACVLIPASIYLVKYFL